jgi:ferritin-like metal-binding protein YciE
MAAEPTTREAKLIQYLNEAYGKEKELETALKAHISMTSRDTYKKRLREHLKETQAQAKGLERRIKQLGGKAEAMSLPGPDAASEAAAKVTSAAKKGVSLAKGPLHMIRGTGEAEKLLKNAKTELFNEMEEIGNYLAIEELANALYDKDTAKLAREFRRQEERMASFLQKLIPQLAKQVVREEVPTKERKPAAAAASGNGARRTTAARSSASSSRSSGTAAKPKAATTRSRSTSSSSRSTGAAAKPKAASTRSRSASGTSRSRAASSSGSSSRSTSGSSRSTTSRSSSGSTRSRAKKS